MLILIALGLGLLSGIGCSSDGGLEILTDVTPLERETIDDAEEEIGDTGDFTGCDPFTASECAAGEKCAISTSGDLACVQSGVGQSGDSCRPGLSSGCGVGLICADTESPFSCCSPYCQQTSDCGGFRCLIIARLPEGQLGYCEGVCEGTDAP